MILVVEDDVYTRAVLTRVLKMIQPNADVQTTESGEEALGILERAGQDAEKPVDFIVADISLMGDMNGTELWEKCHHQAPDIPVMLISGSPIDLYRPFFQKYGVFPPFLRKPFSAGDFKSLYELLLEHHRRAAA